jgi:amino-acid N-acetyltransferase
LSRRSIITLRTGDTPDAPRLHALIEAAQDEGHLLPRTPADVMQHASRFTVAVQDGTIVGGAELAALSPVVAEVRSLVVAPQARHLGVGGAIVSELRARARREGFERLCAFTHAPGYFTAMGFSIVPHLWLSEKIYKDCVKCLQFRACGQHAMVLPLETARETADPQHVFAVTHA